jgi:hypothetical protein
MYIQNIVLGDSDGSPQQFANLSSFGEVRLMNFEPFQAQRRELTKEPGK